MRNEMTRRELVGGLGAAALALGCSRNAAAAPASTVAVAKCRSYGAGLLPALERMFDQLGGLGRLVKGKTVAIKLNLTGGTDLRLGYTLPEDAQWTHPSVIAATAHLLDKAGARRIRLLESPWSTTEPLEEFMLAAGWNPDLFTGSAARVEFENTNYLGSGKKYSRLRVPGGGHMFRAFDLNHSYEDCDVFVSLAKLKEHATTGVTLAMKNCFGITPCTIYGQSAGVDEPSREPGGGRSPFHDGSRQPSKSAPPENDPASPRDPGYRVPRIVADLVAARPVHLSIIEGIKTMAGGEGPWISGARPVSPGILLAGLNPVSTDAVATAIMGFDPMGRRGQAPFETCDSTLELAERHGVGTRDLSRIEVAGTPIREARFEIRKL